MRKSNWLLTRSWAQKDGRSRRENEIFLKNTFKNNFFYFNFFIVLRFYIFKKNKVTIPVEVGTTSAQILFPRCYSLLKGMWSP